MREVIPKVITLKQHVMNSSRLAMLVAGALVRDLKLFAKGMDDEIVEPSRAPYVPCYSIVKKEAVRSGALAVTISGAGPSLIAVCEEGDEAKVIKAIKSAYSSCGIKVTVKVAKPADSAEVIRIM